MTAPTFLLASDLDGTLIPTGSERIRTLAVAEFTRQFESRREAVLAYVTGRDLQLALEAVEGSGLPKPDFLACDVGTILYRREGRAYKRDWAYASRVRKAFGSADAGAVRRTVFRTVPQVQLQEDHKQGEFKVSFYTPPGVPSPGWLPALEEALVAGGAQATVVFSQDPLDSRGLIDILPKDISKVSPIRQLAIELNLANDKIVYAGDSGNDETALLGGFLSIVVGNAAESLKARLRKLASERNLEEHIYFAEADYAAGVLEGCRRFGLI
jgi:HAD superfamily hydrolase (TIGR01484 family)